MVDVDEADVHAKDFLCNSMACNCNAQKSRLVSATTLMQTAANAGKASNRYHQTLTSSPGASGTADDEGQPAPKLA